MYDVYLEANDSSPNLLVCNDVLITECHVPSLQAGTDYYWQVVATIDGIGVFYSVSPTWTFTIEGTPQVEPVAYYPFTGNANDHSGNDHHGAVNGATLVTDRNGNSEQAYQFDGNDHIQFSDPILTGPPYSFSLWTKIDAVRSNNQYLFSNGASSGGSEGLSLLLIGTSYQYCGQSWPSGSMMLTVANDDLKFGSSVIFNIPLAQWVHIAGVWEGEPEASNILLYLNGQLQEPECATTLELSSQDHVLHDMRFGAESNNFNQNLTGLLDEARFFDRALTEAEINVFYNEQVPHMIVEASP